MGWLLDEIPAGPSLGDYDYGVRERRHAEVAGAAIRDCKISTATVRLRLTTRAVIVLRRAPSIN